MRPMRMLRLIVHGRTRQPVLLLGEINGDRCLPIFLRSAQAEVISVGERDNTTSLPQDVIEPVVEALGSRLVGAEITGLSCGVFSAELILEGDLRVAVKPSDALAIAVREGLPIGVEDEVLDEVGQPTTELLGADPGPATDQLREFRDFLEDVTPDDFRR